jgi:hypothetical protein
MPITPSRIPTPEICESRMRKEERGEERGEYTMAKPCTERRRLKHGTPNTGMGDQNGGCPFDSTRWKSE